MSSIDKVCQLCWRIDEALLFPSQVIENYFLIKEALYNRFQPLSYGTPSIVEEIKL